MYTSLTVLVPPTAEPNPILTVRKHCRIDNDDDDDLLGLYQATARTMAENYLGRALVTQTLRYTVSRSPPTGGWPVALMAPIILPLWLPFELLYQRPINLPRSPVQSIVQVTISNVDGSTSVIPTTGFSSDVTAEPSRILLGPGYQPQPEQDIAIDFVAGYPPGTIPALINLAILFGTAWLYEHRGDEGMDIPEAFYLLLTPYRLVGFGA